MTQSDKTERAGLLRRFARANQASVAVEFALTAIPFFMVLFAIIEGGIVFFTTATLDNAVNDVGRLIRTGQAQTGNMTTAQLVEKICGEVVFVSNCTTNLKIDVRTYSSFSSVAFPTPVDPDGNLITTLQFNMGSAGDIVLVRAFYVWNVLSPLPTGLANNTGSSRLIQSSVAFRNEPYSS
ncbi:TadE/TadG family type IV pilus assembly protein [Parvibaculum sp.]|uniref:TadE/TadG family type IV pilus assembly protein n=1 Tax=Parvibaculum sp. TaxID=2024848 RepID=UPI00320F775C